MTASYSLAVFMVAVATQVLPSLGNVICLPPQSPASCAPYGHLSMPACAASSSLNNVCPAPTVISTPPVSIPLSLPNAIPLGTFAAVKSVSIKPFLTPGLNCDNNIGFSQTAPTHALTSCLSSAPCAPYGSFGSYSSAPSGYYCGPAQKPQVIYSC